MSRYKEHPIVEKLGADSRDCDYIIAPIADNRMFQIINSFIDGEITDEQCKHCLAATNLGFQYVFISDNAINRVQILERCYLSGNEKEYYNKRISFLGMELSNRTCKGKQQEVTGKLFEKETAGNRR